MPDKDIVTEARELLGSVDKSLRVEYAFRLLRALADEVERLRERVKNQSRELVYLKGHCHD